MVFIYKVNTLIPIFTKYVGSKSDKSNLILFIPEYLGIIGLGIRIDKGNLNRLKLEML